MEVGVFEHNRSILAAGGGSHRRQDIHERHSFSPN